VALLASDTLPLTDPATVGANFTLNVVLCPAVKLSGGVSPLAVKPTPETVSWEMFAVEFPELVRVTVLLLLLPRFTFP